VAASLKNNNNGYAAYYKRSHKIITVNGTLYDELYLENFTQSNSNIKTSEILTKMYHSTDATD